MRENRNNQYRPEQIQYHIKLRDSRPTSIILMEYPVYYTNEQGKNRVAIADIADITLKEFYRLNGLIHNSRVVKDWEQKEYLTGLGWKVIDVDV